MYQIKDINLFAKTIRKRVATDAGFRPNQYKKYITLHNIKRMIAQRAVKNDDGYYIDEDGTELVCSDIFEWLVGVDLARLAALDIVQCYWDNDQDCMVFYNTENNK
jgi:hypothetical protein